MNTTVAYNILLLDFDIKMDGFHVRPCLNDPFFILHFPPSLNSIIRQKLYLYNYEDDDTRCWTDSPASCLLNKIAVQGKEHLINTELKAICNNKKDFSKSATSYNSTHNSYLTMRSKLGDRITPTNSRDEKQITPLKNIPHVRLPITSNKNNTEESIYKEEEEFNSPGFY